MHCTVEQKVSLASMMHPGVRLGAVRREFADKLLMSNGVLSDEIDAMMSVVLSLGNDAKTNEVSSALQEHRFLFLLDEDGVPHTYFQCAVSGNPDVERAEHPTSSLAELEEANVVVECQPPDAVSVPDMVPLVRLGQFRRLWMWLVAFVCRGKGR